MVEDRQRSGQRADATIAAGAGLAGAGLAAGTGIVAAPLAIGAAGVATGAAATAATKAGQYYYDKFRNMWVDSKKTAAPSVIPPLRHVRSKTNLNNLTTTQVLERFAAVTVVV